MWPGGPVAPGWDTRGSRDDPSGLVSACTPLRDPCLQTPPWACPQLPRQLSPLHPASPFCPQSVLLKAATRGRLRAPESLAPSAHNPPGLPPSWGQNPPGPAPHHLTALLPHSLCSSHAGCSRDTPGPVLPQDLYTGCALCLEGSSPDVSTAPHLPSFSSHLKCHFLPP